MIWVALALSVAAIALWVVLLIGVIYLVLTKIAPYKESLGALAKMMGPPQ